MPNPSLFTAALTYCCIFIGLMSPSRVLANPDDAAAPRFEVCFVLDTTGSMTRLISGAKQKIWAIADEMISLEPRPEIKFCLIGYRDRGDVYITRVTDLTRDIDELYRVLLAFKADGGGDGPESVNRALYESVTDISWSADNETTIKVIYLVGDYPPHMDYPNEVRYPQTVTMAKQKDIVINTIQCGDYAPTTPVWREIASNSGGHYSHIPQGGNVRITKTPMDQDFVTLNIKLGETLLPYGTKAAREAIKKKQSRSEAANGAVVADRLSFNNRLNKIIQTRGDLIDDIDRNLVRLEDIPVNRLPAKLRGMTPAERRSYVASLSYERKEYQRIIKSLVEARKQYIVEHSAGTDTSFDKEVIKAVKALAAKKGFRLN